MVGTTLPVTTVSFVAQEELSKVWKSNPDGVIVMSSGLLSVSSDQDYGFKTESLCYTAEAWSLNNAGIHRARYKTELQAIFSLNLVGF